MKNVLIVEDDFTCREVMRAFLREFGSCNIVMNGEEAVSSFALELSQKKGYDVVFLDIMMPAMDGQEVLRRIRELESGAGIEGQDRCKVVMTTALSDSQSVMKAFREECDAYLVKPITRDKLKKVLLDIGLAG